MDAGIGLVMSVPRAMASCASIIGGFAPIAGIGKETEARFAKAFRFIICVKTSYASILTTWFWFVLGCTARLIRITERIFSDAKPIVRRGILTVQRILITLITDEFVALVQ